MKLKQHFGAPIRGGTVIVPKGLICHSVSFFAPQTGQLLARNLGEKYSRNLLAFSGLISADRSPSYVAEGAVRSERKSKALHRDANVLRRGDFDIPRTGDSCRLRRR